MSQRKVLFFLSGSIAAFKAAAVISKLIQQGHEVQTVATPSALKFIGAATLEGLTGKPVLSDIWEYGRAMDHIHLSRSADIGVLCPASANTISRIARGSADDLVSTMILAWPKEKPLHIFPAMNHEMLSHPATQKNLGEIQSFGYLIHETGAGNLACGEEGGGRLMEAEDILNILTRKTEPKGSLLITSGATRESIDGIRFLSNVSTGATGAELADQFAERGWAVDYLCAEGAKVPKTKMPTRTFTDFKSLDSALREQLGNNNYSMVIHAAAVSDYSVDTVNAKAPEKDLKLSSQEDLTLRLKQNFKILPRLKEYSKNKNIYVVGFKLTLNETPQGRQKIADQMIGENINAVVANDWSQVIKDRGKHPGEFIQPSGTLKFENLSGLSAAIEGALCGIDA